MMNANNEKNSEYQMTQIDVCTLLDCENGQVEIKFLILFWVLALSPPLALYWPVPLINVCCTVQSRYKNTLTVKCKQEVFWIIRS